MAFTPSDSSSDDGAGLLDALVDDGAGLLLDDGWAPRKVLRILWCLGVVA